MKNNFKIIIAIFTIIVIGVFVYYQKAGPAPINEQSPVISEPSFAGCYAVHFNKDVYTLNIFSHDGESFKGALVFKNFEKDSSSGTFNGTYKDGILLGDYSFQSEGLYSVMQVIFKKSGDDFIRGYGPVNATGDRFADINDITYDQSAVLSVFKKSTENCATSL